MTQSNAGAMNAAITGHIDGLHSELRKCSAAATVEHRAALGSVHEIDGDISHWIDKIDGPEAVQLRAARRELALAEFCAASGLYRQAFASLRLFLELSFAAVHFSVNEFERRRWLSDKTDFSWSRALDEHDGVLSRPFVEEFAPAATTDAQRYATDAAGTYRYCSQFIHGKASVSSSIPETLEYRSEVVEDWCSHASRSGAAVLFLLFVRYGLDLNAQRDDELSDTLIARFGHLDSVRSFVGLAQ